MTARKWRTYRGGLLLLGVFVLAGCEKAHHYGPVPLPTTSAEPGKEAKESGPSTEKAKPLDPDIEWVFAFSPPEGDVPIRFVHRETEPEKWKKLPHFWNDSVLDQVGQAAALLGGANPLTAGPLASRQDRVIHIKVPLGLDDPTLFLPPDNPLSLRKWELGKRLFFAETYLADQPGTSCASCHQPEVGYADKKSHAGRNTPTLINSVFHRAQFWDGRVPRLEQVIQRTLEDERGSPSPPGQPQRFSHVWSGVVTRLRANRDMTSQFEDTFGHGPTQDAVGKALACYLRTILAANALQDQAVWHARSRGHRRPDKEDYLKSGDAQDWGALLRFGKDQSDVAEKLVLGDRLFHGKAGCIRCHLGGTFSDGQFHNVGAGEWTILPPDPHQDLGRFGVLPVGLKTNRMIAAFKTPTLRALPRTGPYRHDGSVSDLKGVLAEYDKNQVSRQHFLDPLVRRTDRVGLTDEETNALFLFLLALEGKKVPAQVRTPLPQMTR
jgi:cytochrome c peroxidase